MNIRIVAFLSFVLCPNTSIVGIGHSKSGIRLAVSNVARLVGLKPDRVRPVIVSKEIVIGERSSIAASKEVECSDSARERSFMGGIFRGASMSVTASNNGEFTKTIHAHNLKHEILTALYMCSDDDQQYALLARHDDHQKHLACIKHGVQQGIRACARNGQAALRHIKVINSVPVGELISCKKTGTCDIIIPEKSYEPLLKLIEDTLSISANDHTIPLHVITTYYLDKEMCEVVDTKKNYCGTEGGNLVLKPNPEESYFYKAGVWRKRMLLSEAAPTVIVHENEN